MVAEVRELVAYRALIQALVLRDLKARYRGSALGLLWTLLNPLLHMAVYVLIFSVYMRNDMDRYAAFLLCGLLPWIWLSTSLMLGATSIVDGGSLLKKVFFPPQVLPTVTVMANFTNFLLGIPLLFGLLLLYGVELRWPLFLLPAIMAAQFALTLGLTLTLSAASVRYRDIPPILGHLLTFWFFLSPIIYPAAQVPERFRSLVSLNPFAPFAVAYQEVLLYNSLPAWDVWAGMATAAIGALLCGLLVFGRFRWTLVEEV